MRTDSKVYTLGSLFDGSGGFPLAGSLCGIVPVWASEIEPYPIAVTRSRFPRMRHLGDISKVNGEDIPPVDIITFGSPCQDMSIAGKRAGLKHESNGDDETTRSGMFMEAVRIIKEMRKATNGQYPRFALWENVPGAFSSNKGEDFRLVLEELIKIVEPTCTMPPAGKNGWPYADAYLGDGWSVAYRVFDAQYWGVPQRRRRIHLVADFRGERATEILFEREGVRGYFAEGRTPWQGTAGDAESRTATDDCEGDSLTFAAGFKAGQSRAGGIGWQDECAATLSAEASGTEPTVVYLVENHPADSRVNIDASGKVQTLTSRMGTGGGNVPMVLEIQGDVVEKESQVICMATQQGGAEIRTDDKAPTLTAAAGMSGNNQPVVVYSPTPCSWDGGQVTSTLTAQNAGGSRRMPDKGNFNCVIEPVYCLQGNGIDRADTAGCNGKGVKEDVCYTLNTVDRPAVVYTLSSKQQSLAIGNDVAGTIGANDYKEPQVVATMDCAGVDCRNMKQAKPNGGQSLNFSGAVRVRCIVRRLTPTECARLQGFADCWGDIDPKDDFTEDEYRFWMDVRNTHAAINGRAVKGYTKAQMLKWYASLGSDSAEYKLWGNGIALPPAMYCMQGILDALERDNDETC